MIFKISLQSKKYKEFQDITLLIRKQKKERKKYRRMLVRDQTSFLSVVSYPGWFDRPVSSHIIYWTKEKKQRRKLQISFIRVKMDFQLGKKKKTANIFSFKLCVHCTIKEWASLSFRILKSSTRPSTNFKGSSLAKMFWKFKKRKKWEYKKNWEIKIFSIVYKFYRIPKILIFRILRAK